MKITGPVIEWDWKGWHMTNADGYRMLMPFCVGIIHPPGIAAKGFTAIIGPLSIMVAVGR